MPANPIPGMYEHWGGSKARALADATKVFGEVRAQPCLFLYGRLGGFRIRVGDGWRMNIYNNVSVTHSVRYVTHGR